jgi:hypothetical protein
MPEIYISYFTRQPLASIPVFLTALPIALVLYKRAFLDKAFLIFLIYLIAKFLIDLTMFEWASRHKNTMILYNLNVPVRYALSAWIFAEKMEIRKQQFWIYFSIPAFVLFAAWDLHRVNPSMTDLHNHKMVLFSTTVESLLMLFWILLYFYNTIRALKIPNLLNYPFFWMCSGLLIYYSSFLFIAPVLHYATQWDQWLEIGFLSYVPYLFEIVSILLFSIGIFQFPQRAHAKQ